MKLFMFLIILVIMQNVSAIAVIPAKLEYEVYSNDFQEKEFLIYNNNNHRTNYSIISSDWLRFYPSNSIELDQKSSKRIKAILETENAEKGKYETKIYVKEITGNKGLNFENGLAIKTFINILSGEKRKEDQEDIKVLKIEDNLDEVAKENHKEINANKTDNYFFILLAVVLILVLANIIKRFK